MRRLPGIISDIDGVLVRGKTPISRSAAALKYIRSPLNHLINGGSSFVSASPIPFTCLTNGGGMLEANKAISINKIL